MVVLRVSTMPLLFSESWHQRLRMTAARKAMKSMSMAKMFHQYSTFSKPYESMIFTVYGLFSTGN